MNSNDYSINESPDQVSIGKQSDWTSYGKSSLHPIEEFKKSEDSPEEIKKYHLMCSTEKDILKKSGNDPLKYWKSFGRKLPLEYKAAVGIHESPDYVQEYGLNYRDDDSVPFGCYRSSNKEIVIVGIGEKGCDHGSIESYSRVMKGSQIFHEFSGRAWLKKKVISFWEFPDKETFNKIINGLESKLRKKGWIKKPMWNNGWKVEILLVKGEVPIDSVEDWEWPKESDFDEITHKEIPSPFIKLIPIENYLKSENFPDEIKQWHLMTSREKEELRRSGNDPLKYWKSLGKDVPLAYKQAIYQEKMIIKFKDFEKNF